AFQVEPPDLPLLYIQERHASRHGSGWIYVPSLRLMRTPREILTCDFHGTALANFGGSYIVYSTGHLDKSSALGAISRNLDPEVGFHSGFDLGLTERHGCKLRSVVCCMGSFDFQD